MTELLELGFPFSASFDEEGGGLAAHNYTLWLATEGLPRPEERRLRASVETEIVARIGSRDLGRDVDFLKGGPLTEARILSELWPLVSRLIAPRPLYRLSLERQGLARVSLAPDAR